ncbi:hypothetical protein HK405_000547, partial [Cladochytrium tenue]
IHVNYIVLNQGSDTFAFSLANGSSNLNTMTAQIHLTMNVSVYNPNMYDLQVDAIALRAYLMCNQTAIGLGASPSSLNIESIIGPAPVNQDADYTPSYTPLIGTSSSSSRLFPSKGNISFIMDFLFSYHPDTEVGLIKDPAFAEMLNVCGVTSGNRTAQVAYVATSTVQKLSAIGYAPTLSDSLHIKCPISQAQIQEIEDNPESKTDPITVLKSILGNGTVQISS